MWTGAKQAWESHMSNVAFLRTHIELINRFFAPNEVSEIWITFPDPQMSKVNKRTTSTRFMKLYSEILTTNGLIHLKTDSLFMFTYTCKMAQANQFPILIKTNNLYGSCLADEILSIQTFYEQQWLERGLNIKYLRFICGPRDIYIEPNTEIEPDDYRSYNRSKWLGKTAQSGNNKGLITHNL
jgi:tRNA (guanine-N7-)-methyltransferase